MAKHIEEEGILEGASQEVPKVDPKVQREVDTYTMGLSKLLHGKESSREIMEMLKGGEPQTTIPATALLVNGMMESSIGNPPSLDVLVAAGSFLVGDLIEIGNAAGIFQLETEEQIGPILQETMQKYIEDGLEKGTIDPIELQEKTEGLMSAEQQGMGMRDAGANEVPMEPDQNTAMQAYGAKMERKGALKGGQQAEVKMKKALGGR